MAKRTELYVCVKLYFTPGEGVTAERAETNYLSSGLTSSEANLRLAVLLVVPLPSPSQVAGSEWESQWDELCVLHCTSAKKELPEHF